MEITLKAVQYLERGSQETYNFVADVYVNGVLAGHASNDGHGGETRLDWAYGAKDKEAAKKLFKDAEAYCEALPPVESSYPNGDGTTHTFSYPSTFETVVDALFDEWLKDKDLKKFAAKIQKECIKRVVIGDDKGFSSFGWPNFTIDQMVTKHEGVLIDALKKRADKITPDNRILNANIPARILKAAGIPTL